MKLNKNIKDWMTMKADRYVSPKGTIMDVKWESDSDNGWAVAGNDWSQVLSGAEFPITYGELLIDGWKKVYMKNLLCKICNKYLAVSSSGKALYACTPCMREELLRRIKK